MSTAAGALLNSEPGLLPPLGSEPTAAMDHLTTALATTGDSVISAVELAEPLADGLFPAGGPPATYAQRWTVLATLGAVDLSAARVVEPHLDARAILEDARQEGHGVDTPSGLLGVYAAEAAGTAVTARHGEDGSVLLSGVKPWCSLAALVSHALVTARTEDGQRGLYLVDLRHGTVSVEDGTGWVSHGLPNIVSLSVSFCETPALAVGPPDWYLRRPGFAWGGIGVSAVWHGASWSIARSLVRRDGREPDQMAQYHVGACSVLLSSARASLMSAALEADAASGRPVAPNRTALEARSLVAQTCEEILRHADHASGPAPLALDASYASRHSDLTLYVRQWHAERDLARLGALVLDATP